MAPAARTARRTARLRSGDAAYLGGIRQRDSKVVARPARQLVLATVAQQSCEVAERLRTFGQVRGSADVAGKVAQIAREVHTSPANSIWVVNAYQLAVTISLLPLSSLGEIYGYRRIYQAGLVLFTVASLACALSSSLPTLIIAQIQFE